MGRRQGHTLDNSTSSSQDHLLTKITFHLILKSGSFTNFTTENWIIPKAVHEMQLRTQALMSRWFSIQACLHPQRQKDAPRSEPVARKEASLNFSLFFQLSSRQQHQQLQTCLTPTPKQLWLYSDSDFSAVLSKYVLLPC